MSNANYPTITPWEAPTVATFTPEQLAYLRAWLLQDPLPLPLGQITGAGGLFLNGRIHADGSIASGVGFKVNHSGTGIYEITYDRPFAIEPFVVATLLESPIQSGGAVVYGLDSHDEAGFTIHWVIVGAPDADQRFQFFVYRVPR